MNNWPYRPLSDFLIECEGRFKPNDPKIASYKRLDKIDFSGKIHISEKPSKTDMIIIEPGDLVISGINVAKGALAVYDGDEPVTATIHYSSYRFNKNKIDIEFLKRFLKSPAFISELQDQVKGGIKTEIKPKHLLPLKARIPELAEQQKINHYFDAIDNEISDLSSEVNTQSSYLTKLRQAILQEAIEGKLTVDWRKENPVRKGDPDYDAEALLEKIQAEKEALAKDAKRAKKQKPLPPIKQEEVPFELPEGWVWTRLGDVGCTQTGTTPSTTEKANFGNYIPFIKPADIANDRIDYDNEGLSEKGLKSGRLIEKNSVLMVCIGGSIGKCFFTIRDVSCNQQINAISPHANIEILFLLNSLQSSYFYREVWDRAMKSSTPIINKGKWETIPIPIPPIAEQQAIVDRVEKHLTMVDELEKQVTERKEHSEQLMQAVLREAFEGGK